MRTEIIPGLKGVHAITEDGKVINIKTGRVLKTSIGTTGYERVSINLGHGKAANIKIHRLVASAFVNGRTAERNQVNHIDGNKFNNHASNLEWCTQSENTRHAIRTGLIDFSKFKYKGGMSHSDLLSRNKKIIDAYLTENVTHRELAKRFGLSKTQTSLILKPYTKAA